MRRVRRPATAADTEASLAELRAALDDEGVRPGEHFIVERVGAPEGALGPFVAGSDTSRSAALKNYPRSGTQRHLVLQRLRFCASTRDELAQALHLPDSTVDPRVWELIRGGWVQETGATRTTRAGSEAHVLELTEKALAYQENGGGA